MSRYTGPKWKISRRLRFSILETGDELKKRPYAPGPQGNNKKKKVSMKKLLIKHAPAIVISFAAFVLLVGVLLAVFQAKEELVQYTIKDENVYMYVQDMRMDFYSTITLDHEENITKLYIDEEYEMDMGTEPLYYENKEEVIFPNTMSVILPVEGKMQRKLNRYTTINGEGIQAIISNQNLKYALTNGFVYDGSNLYFFVEKGTLSWGTNKAELSPMSMVSCYYQGDLSIYDYEKNEAVLYENVTDDVIMTFEDYSVNLSYDSVAVDNSSFLLHKNIEKLAALEK